MNEGHRKLTHRKPENYQTALNMAWECLTALDFEEVAKRSNATLALDGDGFVLTFFSKEYRISPSRRIVSGPDDREVKSFIAVLLLHYLAYARDIEPAGELITFRDLEGGDVYYDAFLRRSVIPITNVFGSNSEALSEAGEKIKAEPVKYGDVSLLINVLPKVPVTVILWEGDDEVPASSNILFDASIKELLPTEDVAVIGGFVASILIKNKPEWFES
jgi:hypothetical protein